MYDLVAVGDATLDVFMKVDEASVSCSVDTHSCQLCFSYADKIAVDQVDFIIGGNAANAAVGARRLGFSSAFFSTVGDDSTGKQILDVFHKEGVSTDYLTVAKGALSNYSVVLNFQAERTILVHHVPREYVWNIHEAPQWFYLTSMGSGFEAVYERVVDAVRASHCRVAYNPGTHQLKKGLEFLRPSLQVTDILFLNKEESALLLSMPENTPVADLIHGLHEIGVKIVVITDGPKGAYASDGREIFYLGIFDGPVVERTGAGDSFGTAFTAAIMQGKTIPEAMMWGSANATSVVAQVGPQAGLLTEQGIHDMIAKNQHVQPVKLTEQPAQSEV